MYSIQFTLQGIFTFGNSIRDFPASFPPISQPGSLLSNHFDRLLTRFFTVTCHRLRPLPRPLPILLFLVGLFTVVVVVVVVASLLSIVGRRYVAKRNFPIFCCYCCCFFVSVFCCCCCIIISPIII